MNNDYYRKAWFEITHATDKYDAKFWRKQERFEKKNLLGDPMLAQEPFEYDLGRLLYEVKRNQQPGSNEPSTITNEEKGFIGMAFGFSLQARTLSGEEQFSKADYKTEVELEAEVKKRFEKELMIYLASRASRNAEMLPYTTNLTKNYGEIALRKLATDMDWEVYRYESTVITTDPYATDEPWNIKPFVPNFIRKRLLKWQILQYRCLRHASRLVRRGPYFNKNFWGMDRSSEWRGVIFVLIPKLEKVVEAVRIVHPTHDEGYGPAPRWISRIIEVTDLPTLRRELTELAKNGEFLERSLEPSTYYPIKITSFRKFPWIKRKQPDIPF